MATVRVESASHWYDTLGSPCHEVQRADGKGMRNTTLADARKLRLLPSVTNVRSVLNKPYLAAWKATQYIDAFQEVVSAGVEGDRVAAAVELAEQRMAMPRDLGTLYHHVISDLIRSVESQMEVEWGYLANFPAETNPETIGAFLRWYRDHCSDGTSEKPFASPDGYGGCVDWYGFYRDDPADEPEFAVIDFKTQGTKEGKPVRSYSEWAVQLAAYANGIGVGNVRLINLVISTPEPGRIEVVEWPEGVEFWYQNFLRVFAVWRSVLGKDYDPRGE